MKPFASNYMKKIKVLISNGFLLAMGEQNNWKTMQMLCG
jgi:hypothetical protein